MRDTQIPKRLLAAVLVALLVPSIGSAQSAMAGGPRETGRILGKVLAATSGRPLSGAQVFVAGGVAGSLTDLDGRYVIGDARVGIVSVTVQLIGYTTKTVADVSVSAGRVAVLDITVTESAVAVEGIVVEATRERGSQAFLLDQRRTASSLVEAVGSAEIARRPDSDVADVAQRMAGVTVTDGKYVFVRGLGERY